LQTVLAVVRSYIFAAFLYGGEPDHGISGHGSRPELLAFHGWARHWVELVTIGTYISELVPKHIRGRAFACEQAVGFMAVPVVALLSYLLVPHKLLGLDGWRWVVIIGAHGALFVWFIRRALPKAAMARAERQA